MTRLAFAMAQELRPHDVSKSGGVHRVADLARAYGFTDIDGRQVEAFEL